MKHDDERLAAELAALDEAYAWCDEHTPTPPDEEVEDEMELLRRAALDHRGQP